MISELRLVKEGERRPGPMDHGELSLAHAHELRHRNRPAQDASATEALVAEAKKMKQSDPAAMTPEAEEGAAGHWKRRLLARVLVFVGLCGGGGGVQLAIFRDRNYSAARQREGRRTCNPAALCHARTLGARGTTPPLVD